MKRSGLKRSAMPPRSKRMVRGQPPRRRAPKVVAVVQDYGPSKRDTNRRLAGLGLSRRSPENLICAGLAAVEALIIAVQQLPCIVTGKRSGVYVGDRQIRVQAAHRKSRGSYGPDFWNVVPLAKHLHKELHLIGDTAFEAKHRVDLVASSHTTTQQFLARHQGIQRFLDSLPTTRAA